jgi:hypothetical protein
VKRWPLFFIAAPAAVAVWSGWVGLGGMCGFGLVQPFPGIVSWHLNTAITLPVGVESYGAYALGAWLTPETPERARTFARHSAIGALALGMGGQVIFHLLAAAHQQRAPWPVVMLVACLPVMTLGFGAALTHLLRVPAEPDAARLDEWTTTPLIEPEPVPAAEIMQETPALEDIAEPEPDVVSSPLPSTAVSADMSAPSPDITPGTVPDTAPSPKRTPKRTAPRTSRRTPHRTSRGHVRLTNADARTRAAKALRDAPDMSMTELAALIGRSERQARRIRSELAVANGHAPGGGEAR